ncbi:NUDIX hydrolase [Streptomyces xinghaiensis]|uniref:NUDIX hydrolase n=1 Tax=Streptomyces xinghaiensis TaxID=1038928 RepID=UPI0005856DCC|nr:NUDIX domain-containing protein [Streptomyces xinghaiensis]MZE80413.1 NUDIX domain-containing protein [Streptomyces sp. SID5475]
MDERDERDERVERVDEQDRVIGVVGRRDAIRNRWLYRMSMVLCRDPEGRYLVHRRPGNSSRFPGEYSWLIAGAVGVGEAYEDAAARELHEELGVRAPVRPVFRFLCDGQLSPYWFAVHEAVVEPERIAPDPAEIAGHTWLSGAALNRALEEWPFVSDSLDAAARYRELVPGAFA